MNFLEEHPGPIGKLEVNAPDPDQDGNEPPKKWRIWLAIGCGLFLVSLGLYIVFENVATAGIGSVLVKLGCFAAYVLISHWITATPDYSNVGWLGGLMDNPFQASDNYNRWLAIIQAILLPGKFMAYSLVLSWLISQHLYEKLNK